MKPPEVDVHALRGGAAPPVAAPAGLRVPSRRLVARARELLFAHADLAALLGLAAFSALLAALTWGTWGDPAMDTGYDLLAGARTDSGELPYVDYVYFYGPLAPVLLGQVFDVLGTSIGSAVGVGLAVAALIVAATYALARSLAGPLAGLLAGALTAAAALSSANNSFVLPHTLTAPLAVLLSLGALLAAIAAARDRRLVWFLAAGLCAGGVTLARAELTLALFATLALWLLLRALDARDTRRSVVELALVALPALSIPAVVYGLALTQVSPRVLLTENLFPVDYLREAGDVVVRQHAPLTPGSLAEPVGRLLLYAAGAAALIGLGVLIARHGRARLLAGVVGGGAALAFLVVLAARPETVRYYLEFAYAWIPAGAWLMAGVLLWRYKNRASGWGSRAQMELLTVVFLAALATKSYATFLPQPNPVHPPDTPYLLPFIGAFLAWLHLRELPRGHAGVRAVGAGWLAALVVASAVLVVGDARDETVTVSGPGGSLTALPKDGPAFQQALDVIERETAPGEPILLAPQMTSLYVLSERTSALPQLSLLPGMLADEGAEREAIAALELHNVRLAITDRTPMTTYEHGAFGETYDRRLARWLRTEFRRTGTLSGSGSDPRVLDVWQRRTP